MRFTDEELDMLAQGLSWTLDQWYHGSDAQYNEVVKLQARIERTLRVRKRRAKRDA